MASNLLFDRFLEELETNIDPIQIIVGGITFDTKKIDKSLSLSAAASDIIIDATLRDGRILVFSLSSLQGFITGRSWE